MGQAQPGHSRCSLFRSVWAWWHCLICAHLVEYLFWKHHTKFSGAVFILGLCPLLTTSWVLGKPGSEKPLCRDGRAEWLFPFVHWGEIKGILGKKAVLTKLSCPGNCCTQKLIVQGVGIPGFPTALAKLSACFHLETEMDIN